MSDTAGANATWTRLREPLIRRLLKCRLTEDPAVPAMGLSPDVADGLDTQYVMQMPEATIVSCVETWTKLVRQGTSEDRAAHRIADEHQVSYDGGSIETLIHSLVRAKHTDARYLPDTHIDLCIQQACNALERAERMDHERQTSDERAQPHTAQPTERSIVRTSNKAVLALIFALLAFCVPLFGIVAVILGAVAKRDIERSGGTLDGAGLAISGIVIGVVGGLIGFAVNAALMLNSVDGGW